MRRSILIISLLISFGAYSKSTLPELSDAQKQILKAQFGIVDVDVFYKALADEAHNIWKRTASYPERLKPMKDEAGVLVTKDNIEAYFETKGIPKELRTEKLFRPVYDAKTKITEIHEDIKNLDNRYLSFKNRESNDDLARETIEAFLNITQQYIDESVKPAKEVLVDELKNVHMWWKKRNSWADSIRYTPERESLSIEMKQADMNTISYLFQTVLMDTVPIVLGF
ncbi:MAG: hypothetical protein JNL11_08580 [Bdellovibrionaceae bacterium]|nr:hypothetical protein [Pseudobdellovibrionaceae bacterium]